MVGNGLNTCGKKEVLIGSRAQPKTQIAFPRVKQVKELNQVSTGGI